MYSVDIRTVMSFDIKIGDKQITSEVMSRVNMQVTECLAPSIPYTSSAVLVESCHLCRAVARCRGRGVQHLHGILVAHSDFDSLLCLHVQLGVLACLHGCLQAAHKGAVLQSLVREVLELVQDDLSVHHHEALACSYLHEDLHCMHAGSTHNGMHLAL